MQYLSNAFSLNMLGSDCFPSSTVQVDEVAIDVAAEFAKTATSVVGHQDTAAVLSAELGVPVAFNRTTVSLQKGDVVLVGQYRGPRLPEGATSLPQGASISWYLVSIR